MKCSIYIRVPKMIKVVPAKFSNICENCGSKSIVRTKGKAESYCKKCGAVVEELLETYE